MEITEEKSTKPNTETCPKDSKNKKVGETTELVKQLQKIHYPGN